MSDDKHPVRQRAYEIWEMEGRPEGRHAEHWHEAETALAREAASGNQGEGNVGAARTYNEQTRKFVEEGRVEAAAKSAEQALDGPEAESLKQAETAGRKRSHAPAESTSA